MPKGRKKSSEAPPGYTPPANPEAEQSVLGAILVRPIVLDEVVDLLQPEDFYREAHANIYRVMLGLYNSEQPVDLVTVTSRLKEVGWLEGIGGPVFLAGLSEQVGFATNALYYAKIVQKMAVLRRLLDASQEIAWACLAPVEDLAEFVSEAELKVSKVMQERGVQEYALADLFPEEVKRTEALHEKRDRILGVPSGFTDLDQLTAGFQKTDLILLAARPSMGKTALALNISINASYKERIPVAFFSLEMSKEQLTRRLISSVGSIDGTRLRTARMESQDWINLNSIYEPMESDFYITEKARTMLQVRTMARRLQSRRGIGLVILDYLQLMRDPRARNREQEVAQNSAALKALAVELNIPVIALSQLSREVEKRPNKRPMLSDLRESGALEQDADVVVFIYRDEFYKKDSPDKGIAEIHVAKQRNGPTGRIKLTYLSQFTRFENYAEQPAFAGY